MERNGTAKVVWEEGGKCHAVRGELVSSGDALFLKLRLVDGTELNIARSRVIKVEIDPGDRA